MKKALLAAALTVSACLCAFALGVDVTELQSAGRIEFVNYTGPVNIFQSDLNIRGIGRDLGRQAAQGAPQPRVGLKYSALHVVGTEEPEKFSADIISLDRDAKVDHIANVRRIVSSYLETLYRYPRRDADLLALFVSYYNAVHRRDFDYFSGKYKTVVLAHLDAQRVGISTRWDEWPGQTQMVVPLNEKDLRDVLSALSTSELTSKEVVEQLKAREDKGVTERSQIVELKQKEVAKGEQAVGEEAKKLAEEKTAAEAKAAGIEKAKVEAAALADEQAKKAAEEKISADEQALAKQREAQKAEEERIAAQKQALDEKKEEIAAEKKDIAADRAVVAAETKPEQLKRELEQKSAELAAREQDVAQREEAARKGESDAAIFGGKLYYLNVREYLSGGHYNNDMILINAASGAVILKSPEAGICGRKYDIFPGGVAVITHKGDHATGHYLTLLDLDTLARKAAGDEPVFYRSFVEVRDDFVYVIVARGSSYYLGKFGLDMKLAAVSKDPVDGDSFISFYGDLVYINREDKRILVLKKSDLSTTATIQP
jgi:hypothetical protein